MLGTNTVDGANTELASYQREESKNHVLWKYADVIDSTIKFKQENPALVATLDFAIYKVNNQVFILNDAAHIGHQTASNSDKGGVAQTITEKLVLAADAGVDVRLIYHNPSEEGGISAALGTGVMHKRPTWCEGGLYCVSSKKMHNKFILSRRGKDVEVYTSSANIDEHDGDQPVSPKSQVGVSVKGRAGLYLSYLNYFDVMWDNHDDVDRFRSEIGRMYVRGLLNYTDDYFEARFSPVDRDEGMDKNSNPYVQAIEELQGDGNYVKVLCYLFGSTYAPNQFATRFVDLLDARQAHIRTVCYNKYRQAKSYNTFPEYDGKREYSAAYTHAKSMSVFNANGEHRYKTIIGSSNLKTTDFTHQANNTLVIKEKTKRVYKDFKKIFYSVYN